MLHNKFLLFRYKVFKISSVITRKRKQYLFYIRNESMRAIEKGAIVMEKLQWPRSSATA